MSFGPKEVSHKDLSSNQIFRRFCRIFSRKTTKMVCMATAVRTLLNDVELLKTGGPGMSIAKDTVELCKRSWDRRLNPAGESVAIKMTLEPTCGIVKNSMKSSE
ncbi:MAG: hypothetical protein A4E62_02798 [Syntrophorhabdus sp. PtaU1.Bin002]|nr:MAG: hypothetical protein A4E62_02798 [Syntrophorhabdus sp. PtaU1.Bin002]